MELPNKKKLNQLDFLNNEIKNNDNKKPNFLNKSISSSKINNQNQTIENILILDTETTGLDENKDEIIEVGCILFNVKSKSVLSQVSFLFPVNSNEAEHVNGIPAEVTNIKQPWEDGLNFFLKLVDCSDLIVAHNVEFDKNGLERVDCPSLKKSGFVV